MVYGIKNRKKITDFAQSGEQALVRIKNLFTINETLKYQLIFIECNLNQMDGFQCAKKIRNLFNSNGIEQQKQPYIVGISDYVDHKMKKQAEDFGMD